MNLDELQALLPDQDAFKRAFRKDEVLELLKGNFVVGRTPYIHQVTFPNGSQIRLKFYDTIKILLNSKLQPIYGKESFLAYLDVTVMPVGQKGYSYTTDVTLSVWGTSKAKALVKHCAATYELAQLAIKLDIDLGDKTAWCSTYTENY
jgi:hypothetical protein